MPEISPEDAAEARKLTPQMVEMLREVRATKARPSLADEARWDAFLACEAMAAVEDGGCGVARITARGRRLLSAVAATKRAHV